MSRLASSLGFAWRAAVLVVLAACGGSPGASVPAKHAAVDGDVRVAEGLPPVAVLTRDGDPKSGVAVTVSTAGIAPERDPEVAAALAGLVEGRLPPPLEAQVLPGWHGYRVRALVGNDDEASRALLAMRAALLAPVTEADMARVRKKLAALSARPLLDPALGWSARCTGEAFGTVTKGDTFAPTLDAVEAWRKAAHGALRVAFATVGSRSAGDAAARALARAGGWPKVTRPAKAPLPAKDATASVYEETSDLPAGGVRATLSVFVPRAEDALAAAPLVGAKLGPMATRLGGLEGPARLRDVVATAHAEGGCLDVTFEIAPKDLAGDPAVHIAMAVALARQEVGLVLADGADDVAAVRKLPQRARDPRDSAEQAAWWLLVKDREPGGGVRVATAIGLSRGRDVAPDKPQATGEAIVAALDRATALWQAPVVEAKTRVERGQGEAWVFVGSPCGTLAEGESDAGVSAAAVMAMARGVTDVAVEPFVSPDLVGLVAHGPAASGESPAAHARRIADAAARAFAADPLEPSRASAARGELLRAADQPSTRVFSLLAAAASPQRPSWLAPFGTADALGRSSDTAVGLRAAALRAGPLRVAVIANVDAAQAEAAVRATDRWAARRPFETRKCPSLPPAAAATAGTSFVDVTTGVSEVAIGVPLAAGDAAQRKLAETLAAALGGSDGLLARAVTRAGLARSATARVAFGSHAAALVVRLSTAPGALDAAVSQTRALFDRLRQGALTEEDEARARAALDAAEKEASLDPRARLLRLTRDVEATPAPTGLAALRAFAAAVLKDDVLVIVATRPKGGKSP